MLSAEAKDRRSQRNRIRCKELEHNFVFSFEGSQINLNTHDQWSLHSLQNSISLSSCHFYLQIFLLPWSIAWILFSNFFFFAIHYPVLLSIDKIFVAVHRARQVAQRIRSFESRDGECANTPRVTTLVLLEMFVT